MTQDEAQRSRWTFYEVVNRGILIKKDGKRKAFDENFSRDGLNEVAALIVFAILILLMMTGMPIAICFTPVMKKGIQAPQRTRPGFPFNSLCLQAML
jgi:hypothetical protein